MHIKFFDAAILSPCELHHMSPFWGILQNSTCYVLKCSNTTCNTSSGSPEVAHLRLMSLKLMTGTQPWCTNPLTTHGINSAETYAVIKCDCFILFSENNQIRILILMCLILSSNYPPCILFNTKKNQYIFP